jgi:Transglycosylase SLT domain
MRRVTVVGLVCAMVGAAGLSGCSSSKGGPQGVGALVSASSSPSPTPTPTPTLVPTQDPTAPASPTPSPTPTVAQQGNCAGLTGKNLSKKTILSYMTKASKIDEYTDLDPAYLPVDMNGVKPVVTIPLKLIKAIGAQESGWQSACKGGDGLGFGTMQVTADTQSWVNGKFGETYDRMTPQQNIDLAVAELEWLTVHFGISYFHKTFNLSTNTDLFNAVVASYNVGWGNVDDGTSIQIGPKGSGYVSAVRGLMVNPLVQNQYGK